MSREELIVACTSDLAGKVRGKAFPGRQFEKRLHRGIGWTPTNVQITCFDDIAESPFGSLGDLVLIPDPEARLRLDLDPDDTAEHFVMGAIHHTDGRPWEFCTRAILKAALERLHRVSGLRLCGAFEHEFQFRDAQPAPGNAFTLAGMRAERTFAETVVAAQRAAGVEPDTFLREYGPGQFEVTMGPQEGLRIADHSVFTREIVQAVAQKLGRAVTFTPTRSPTSVGNGAHIHLSFIDAEGRPATREAAGRHEMSQPAAQFVAGILKHLDSIIALTAASQVSYLRLVPHRWSAAFNNLGFRDREAAVRICPVSGLSDVAADAQFHFEFRAADATASPYLQLAALVHAGCQGIEDGLDMPEATQEDLSLLDADALAARGLVRLPQSLGEALERLAADPVVAGWFPQGFVEVYVAHKQGEIGSLEGLSIEEVCARYEAVY